MPYLPPVWLCYVDDMFVLEYDVDGFTYHINNIDDDSNFPIEAVQDNGLSFLDIYINMFKMRLQQNLPCSPPTLISISTSSHTIP